MNNAEVCIICEGQTERTFIRDVLAPEMSYKGIFLHPSLIGKPGHKGGHVHFERAKSDIEKFLKQRPDTYVSTMFDYFRLAPNWPGNQFNGRPAATEKAEKIETATLAERLIKLCKSYRKVAMGKTISEAIGIQSIRKKCPHFNQWLTKFEQLTVV